MAEANNDFIDDIKDDMWTLTDFHTEPTQRPRKKCEEMRRLRAKMYASKNEEEEEEIEICPPLRGRPVGWEKYIPKPGTPNSFDIYKKNVSEQIREVSGLGYSNDVILHKLGFEASTSRFCDADDEHSKNGDCYNSVPLPLHDIIKRGTTKKNNIEVNDMKCFPPL